MAMLDGNLFTSDSRLINYNLAINLGLDDHRIKLDWIRTRYGVSVTFIKEGGK